ncbi:MAG: Hsp20 family protein [Pseudomonadota bacterium]
MARISVLKNPLLLGFDEIERLIDQFTQTSSDGYPPYNIERLARGDGADCLRITLAVAGFSRNDLEITVEDHQIVIRGKQTDDTERVYLHKGIGARQFQKVFLLADGIQVEEANLANGLLTIDLVRPTPTRVSTRVEIGDGTR